MYLPVTPPNAPGQGLRFPFRLSGLQFSHPIPPRHKVPFPMSLPPGQSSPLSLDLNQSVQYAVSRQVITLMKEYLAIMEQLAEEHDEALDKLCAALPPEYHAYVNLADHFTEEKEGRIRKAVLGRGNDCKRAILEELDKYDLEFRHARDAGD